MDANKRKAIFDIAATVLGNLQYQHDWTSLETHSHGHPRPLIRGLPPRRLYIHPDDQVAALNRQQNTGESLFADPEFEWVLPVHLSESWSLKDMAAVFDSVMDSGPRGKRVILATLHSDSTVVYYVVHEGMVKPRQN